ncbi:MAG: hypothetical protein F6K28_49770 [Microcoleus sp. SIO2G3]|nr:hypothetical protein [Microcoleus sp. SIO2G3]
MHPPESRLSPELHKAAALRRVNWADAFYLIAILSIALLFRLVVQLGDRLTAPRNTNGRYVSDRPLPGCSEPCAIELQQSEIYINGRMIALTEASSIEEKPTLTGLWRSSQLSMSGTTAIGCAASQTVDLQGAFKKPRSMAL